MYYCTLQVSVLEQSVEEQKVYLVHTQEEAVAKFICILYYVLYTILIFTMFYTLGWCTGEECRGTEGVSSSHPGGRGYQPHMSCVLCTL